MNKIPKLRFPEFSGEWEEKRFGDISKINQGLQIPISERFLEVGENRHFYITNEFLREGSEKKYYIENPSENVICTEEDILMTRTGNTGQVVTGVKGAFHNNFFKIKYDKNKNDKKFLYYTLTSSKIQNTIIKLAGASTIPDLNHGDFYKIKSYYPSLPEQEEIASFLSSVDSKIEKLERKKELWEQYKKGMMQKIFSQELRFKYENGEDYPEWEEKSLGEISDIRSGLNLDQNTERKGYKVTRIETISSTRIDLDKIGFVETEKNIEEYKLWEGDLLFSNINSVSHIGKMSYVDRNYDLYHGMNLLKIKVNNLNSSKYCYYLLTSKRYKQHFESVCSQAVNQASINQTELKKTILNLPSLPEQTQIADFLSSLDSKIEIVEKELEGMKEFKKGLLQKMFV